MAQACKRGRGGPTRHCQEQEFSQPSIVQNLQLLKVHLHSRSVDITGISLIPRISHIIHAHPNTDDGVLTDPVRVTVQVVTENLDLVNHTQDGRIVRSDNVWVDGGAAVGEVVAQDGGVGGVGCDEVTDPVEAAGGRPAGQGRVAEGVRGGRLFKADIKASLRVRITATPVIRSFAQRRGAKRALQGDEVGGILSSSQRGQSKDCRSRLSKHFV